MRKVIFSLAAMFWLAGCLPQPQTPEQRIANSSDRVMTSALVKPGAISLKNGRLHKFYNNPNAIYFKNSENTTQEMMDGSSDDIAQVYIKTAKSRGGIVKMYKVHVNRAVANIVEQHGAGHTDDYNHALDPVFIEFDSTGKIKSALFRRHYYTYVKAISFWNKERQSWIVFGNIANQIELRLGNKLLEDGYIRTL